MWVPHCKCRVRTANVEHTCIKQLWMIYALLFMSELAMFVKLSNRQLSDRSKFVWYLFQIKGGNNVPLWLLPIMKDERKGKKRKGKQRFLWTTLWIIKSGDPYGIDKGTWDVIVWGWARKTRADQFCLIF